MDVNKKDQDNKMGVINAVLAERFHSVEKILGEGSFGTVVRARHRTAKKSYAIKMMDCDSDQQIKYNTRELGLLAKLQLSDRTNIIQYFESWPSKVENERILCIQMELCWKGLDGYISGNSLGPGPFIVNDETFYKHIFPQILNGLDVIHSAGWIHRDIHPGNLLVALPKPSRIQDIVIKIADFGLARQYERSACLTAQQTLEKLSPITGNNLFRAQELSTEKYSEKVDLYSAGIVLYLLCCYLPNKDQWIDEIKALKLGLRGRQHLCHKDEVLSQLLNNLLQHNPDDRPSARVALEEFPLNKTDGGINAATSTSRVKFLARPEGEDAYKRCFAIDDSLFGIKIAVEKSTGISRENQVIRQEYVADGTKDIIAIDNDEDAKAMIKSAEETGRKVKLTVSVKDPASTAKNPSTALEQPSKPEELQSRVL